MLTRVSLQVGFFDDKKADAIAHNIDPKVLAKQAKQDQWEQFQQVRFSSPSRQVSF